MSKYTFKNLLKMVPYYILSFGALFLAIKVFMIGKLGSNVEPTLQLATLSAYFGIGAIIFTIFQIAIAQARPEYDKDIKELLYINNRLLILKEAGTLCEDDLIDLFKSN